MKVRLKNPDELEYSGNLDDHCYKIDMFGAIFDVSECGEYYYKVNTGKYKNWRLFKRHCLGVVL